MADATIGDLVPGRHACSSRGCWTVVHHAPRLLAIALGYRAERFQPPYLALTDPTRCRPDLLLQHVPEPKRVKNRMHLDLRVPELQAPLERLLGQADRC